MPPRDDAMPKTHINQYKRQDVFRCSHKAHFRFEKSVSVYHVLKEKECFPQGCLYFVWKCKLLNKGNSCPKGYQHVGRDCFSCKNYFDEKMNYQPEILLDPEGYRKFERELEEFEEWLQETRGKWVEFSGTVKAVKPHFRKITFGAKQTISFSGFLISFAEGYIDRAFFEDHIFVSISRLTQQNLRLAAGDEVEFQARLGISRGRIVLDRIRHVEFLHKENSKAPTVSEALVARSTGTEFDCQPEKCMICDKGCLLDVVDKADTKSPVRRHLYCLAGVENPDECVYRLLKKIESEKELRYPSEQES
jgi:hypothetical protein